MLKDVSNLKLLPCFVEEKNFISRLILLRFEIEFDLMIIPFLPLEFELETTNLFANALTTELWTR